MGRTRTFNPALQTSHQFSTADVHAPVAATAAVVTYAALSTSAGTAAVGNQPVPQGVVMPQSVSHVIQGLYCTCASDTVIAAATAPTVKIEDGSGNVVFHAYLTLNSEGVTTGKALYSLDLRFPKPIRGTAGRAMIITMPSNGANTINKLTVLGHTTEIS
jgi:hypothetical protein